MEMEIKKCQCSSCGTVARYLREMGSCVCFQIKWNMITFVGNCQRYHDTMIQFIEIEQTSNTCSRIIRSNETF